MKACPYCAEQLGDKALFCSNCGRELPPASETEAAPIAALPAEAARRAGRNQWLKIFAIVAGAGILLCAGIAVAVGILLRDLTLPAFGPKAQVILAADTSLVKTVDRAGLEQDAQILSERARLLGSPVTFRVTSDSRIIGEGPPATFTEELARQAIMPGLLELVDFGASPQEEGKIIATDFDYPFFPPADGPAWHTLLTNADFELVQVQPSQLAGNYLIAFTLTPSGAKILADFTVDNVGHYLGIVLDRRVISAPVIKNAITDGQGMVEGGFTQDTAQALAANLRVKGPLPVPLVLVEFSPPGK